MAISREDQIEFANHLLPVIDRASDVETLERLHTLAALVLKWSGYENNGVAFDLSEYTYELTEAMRGEKDTGWKDEARRSLEAQLSTEDRKSS